MTTPQQLAGQIDARLGRLQGQREDAQADTTERLLHYRETIVHVHSGELQESLAPYGPFAIGSGVLESRILAGAPQGVFEEQQGGEHASAARTLQEQQAEIDRLTQELARLTAQAVGG